VNFSAKSWGKGAKNEKNGKIRCGSRKESKSQSSFALQKGGQCSAVKGSLVPSVPGKGQVLDLPKISY